MLLEALAALVIAALLLGLSFAAVPRGTGRPRLEAIAHDIATLLREARTEAVAGGSERAALVDAGRRTITAGPRRLALPVDVGLSVLFADSCIRAGSSIAVVFRADGSSCGAVIRVLRGDRGLRIRVSWYTGHVEILAP